MVLGFDSFDMGKGDEEGTEERGEERYRRTDERKKIREKDYVTFFSASTSKIRF